MKQITINDVEKDDEHTIERYEEEEEDDQFVWAFKEVKISYDALFKSF